MSYMAAIRKNIPGAQCAVDESTGEIIVWNGPGQQPTSDQLTAWFSEAITDEFCARIDAEADAARLKIAGDPLRVIEYQRAEAEAKAYAAAGYTGPVPRSVSDWAEAKGWTAQEATDDILRASAAWNDALYAFRGIRLKGKEAVKAVAESDRQAAADAAIAQIHVVLAQVA